MLQHKAVQKSATQVWRVASLIASVMLLVGLAACGSSTSGGSSSTSGKAPGSGSPSLATFQTKLNAAKKSTSKWQGPTTPVTPPKHFRLAIVTCLSALHGCVSPAEGAVHAAKALGWQTSIYDGKGDPTIQSKRIEQALTDKANAIITVAVDGDAVKGALAHAKSAGVPVISTSNATAPGEQGYMFDTSPDLEATGRAIADWMIVDSKGKAVVTPYLDKEFQSNISTEDGLQAELKLCTTCKVNSTQNFVSTDVGNGLGPQTVAYLRKHPDVDYVHASFDPAAADQVPAILQAGLGSHIKLSSILGDSQNLSFITKGQVQASDGAWDNEYEGWATVDQIIRLVSKKPLFVANNVPARFKYGENIPYVLLTKDNLPAGDKDWHASFDYIAKFKKLWGLKG